jgi:hypothetical protein
MSRYVITQLPDSSRKWAVLDRDLYGYCTLPDDPAAERPNLLPLEWNSRAAAEAWLFRCFQVWAAGLVPAPEGWRPWPPGEQSPWA